MNRKSDIATIRKKTLRWGSGTRADSDFAREQILNAALGCYQKYTLQGTRMEKIAHEAKVSRTTLYRHFQNRDEVIQGVIFRELYGILDTIRNQIPKKSSFAEFIVETLVVADEKIKLSPVYELILKESAILLERIHAYGTEMIAIGAIYFRVRFDIAKADGELQPGVEYDEFISWIFHIGASFILMPANTQPPEGLRSMLWRYLLPAIIRVETLPANEPS